MSSGSIRRLSEASRRDPKSAEGSRAQKRRRPYGTLMNRPGRSGTVCPGSEADCVVIAGERTHPFTTRSYLTRKRSLRGARGWIPPARVHRLFTGRPETARDGMIRPGIVTPRFVALICLFALPEPLQAHAQRDWGSSGGDAMPKTKGGLRTQRGVRA